MEAEPGKKGSFRVMYIENDPQGISLLNKDFGALVEVITESNHTEALDYLEMGNPVDLIICHDSASCPDFLKSLRNKAYFQSIPVILFKSNEGADPKIVQGQVIDVFTWPYPLEALRIRLNYLVQKKQYTEAARVPYKPTRVRSPFGKRAFDIAVSATALLMLSPILTVVAVLVKMDSKGPIFYRSKRVGMGYRIFDMYKFRTMRTDADKMLANMASLNMYNVAPAVAVSNLCEECQLAGTDCQRILFLDKEQICEKLYHQKQKSKATFSKFKEDPRVTKLGKFLRNTSIDELPQLFNILIGDMSFVGNRPLPPYEAEKLTSTGYARRFAAPAGLTGLWQVTKRGKSKVSDLERIQLDVLYAKKYSFKTDLIIMIKTVKAVFQKENV
ncbi:sugar transferase [Runella sp.]|uniref:sugar transferase n=1 Tax=Runella sp. TaxID=1960881 RepID=UPI003D0F56D6